MKLKYGKEEIRLPIKDENIIKILNLKKQKALLNPENSSKELFKSPINSPSLRDLIIQKKAKKILIIVNDITRPTSLIQCKMSLKVRVMLLIFYQIIYPFPTVLF